MKLRIHYLNRKGEMAYQDAEFQQPTDQGPLAAMHPDDYEDTQARSFGQAGFQGKDDETGRVFWIPSHCVIEVERLEDIGLVVQ
ncbi:MAG: hypothetical protein V3S71_06470 [Acidobacteriota bacterium]